MLFERYGTIDGVLRHLVAHDLLLPDRRRSGIGKGELDWRRPNRATLSDLLHSPAYAGVYAYGRRAVDPGRRQPGHPATGRRRGHELDDGIILLRDRMPAYISWEAYLRNRDQMQANRTQQRGVARGGPALLAGLVVCGRCGHRMLTVYNNNGRDLRYICGVERASYGTPLCQSLAGRSLDQHIAELVLQAVQPSALETSLQLVEDLELERAEQHRQWRLRLERARYEAERARRQYDAVEPENRLVVRALEQQWEEALTTERRLLAEYERARAEQPVPPSAAEQEAIRRLAADVPALWADPGTTDQDRQTLVRLVLDHIVVTVEGMTEAVIVDAFWAGGVRTRTHFRRPVASLKQLSTYDALASRVAELREAGYTHAAIADTLNAEGWMPAKRCAHCTGGMIGDPLRRQGVVSHQRSTVVGRVDRQANEVTILELAERLAMPHQTVFAWLRRGWLHGRLAEAGGQRIWLIQADEAEIARLAAREHIPKHRSTRPSPHQTL
ncbi:recombinase zinc beta ribbon domain-containing protein [Azospirillum sp. sgz302134]